MTVIRTTNAATGLLWRQPNSFPLRHDADGQFFYRQDKTDYGENVTYRTFIEKLHEKIRIAVEIHTDLVYNKDDS